MLPITVPDNFRIIAHRGASAYAPENTRAAIQIAVEMGVSEVEVDAQLSTDGQVVLCHDWKLERYGHGLKMVEQMSSSELLSLDMGSWFSPYFYRGERMLTLEELFSTYRDTMTYHVELKGLAAGLPRAVSDLIKRHQLRDRCVITSFSFDSLMMFRDLDPEFLLGWLVSQINDEIYERAGGARLSCLCPRADLVTPSLVEQMHALTLEVRAWGLEGSSEEVVRVVRNLVDSGCDGVTIDWPDWFTYSSK